MDVTVGHVFNTNHNFKRNNIHSMETRKRNKYAEHYPQQQFAFAPIVTNTSGQCGPDCLQFIWILADHAVKKQQHPEPIILGMTTRPQYKAHPPPRKTTGVKGGVNSMKTDYEY